MFMSNSKSLSLMGHGSSNRNKVAQNPLCSNTYVFPHLPGEGCYSKFYQSSSPPPSLLSSSSLRLLDYRTILHLNCRCQIAVATTASELQVPGPDRMQWALLDLNSKHAKPQRAL